LTGSTSSSDSQREQRLTARRNPRRAALPPMRDHIRERVQCRSQLLIGLAILQLVLAIEGGQRQIAIDLQVDAPRGYRDGKLQHYAPARTAIEAVLRNGIVKLAKLGRVGGFLIAKCAMPQLRK
jgi:hypothetical protein